MKNAIGWVLALVIACDSTEDGNGGGGGTTSAAGAAGSSSGAAGSSTAGAGATSGGGATTGGAPGGQAGASSGTGGATGGAGLAEGGAGGKPCSDEAASGSPGAGGEDADTPVGSVHSCLGKSCPRGECDAAFGGCGDLYCGPLDASFAYCAASSANYCLVALGKLLEYWVVSCTGGEPTFTNCPSGCGAAGDIASCNE